MSRYLKAVLLSLSFYRLYFIQSDSSLVMLMSDFRSNISEAVQLFHFL